MILKKQYTYGTEDGENMIIRGDNLEALKAFLLQYEGQVKYIYIDPPYNTGNEGWNCPFVYILASISNKTNQVDVEQVLGRILCLPHTKENSQPARNMSYVLTSSNDFNQTVQGIICRLNNAGFMDKDYRLSKPTFSKPQLNRRHKRNCRLHKNSWRTLLR